MNLNGKYRKFESNFPNDTQQNMIEIIGVAKKFKMLFPRTTLAPNCHSHSLWLFDCIRNGMYSSFLSNKYKLNSTFVFTQLFHRILTIGKYCCQFFKEMEHFDSKNNC